MDCVLILQIKRNKSMVLQFIYNSKKKQKHQGEIRWYEQEETKASD
ncbi:hypothetical protein [Staphylococcus argenteus]|nr:hypothetical protein [Staphylococcus argenteus]MDR7649172.1 hypothetical protein [Staphylococcus argenteus]